MNVTFKPKDFDAGNFRGVENTLKGKFGETTYVGANNMVVLVEYSPKLVAMIRPFPPQQEFEYQLKMLKCEDCSVDRPHLAASDENTFVCDKCVDKRRKKK